MRGQSRRVLYRVRAAVRQLIADILSFDGHEVELASDGAEALRLVGQRVYDLILSDLRMPNLDGPGLYWALRRRYGKSIPRIIFVTGQAHTPEYEGFLAAMAEPVLDKSPSTLPRRARW